MVSEYEIEKIWKIICHHDIKIRKREANGHAYQRVAGFDHLRVGREEKRNKVTEREKGKQTNYYYFYLFIYLFCSLVSTNNSI